MKKSKVTRSLLAACSIVALSAVMYGCVHSGDGDTTATEMPPPVDSDNDGVNDDKDAFPMDPDETADADGDGVGDNADLDDDNDGVADVHDGLPLNPMETADADGDGVGDNADLDDDNDGVLDADDAFPMDAAETMDSDGDGVGDNADAFPMDAAETMDSDMDGVGDNADAFDDDATETMDSDMDGVGDNADAFDDDATETMDSDMDGVGDNADAFPMDAAETMDSDGDGVGDNADAFDDDATETMDSDMDGVGDNADAFDDDATETMDSDGDGVGDNADAFDDDATETMDSDMDGVGDNADAFDDDATETMDSDGDGVGDNADAFDDDATETMDSDMDGVGDNADAFPMDAAETMDSDGDSVGDNADAFPNDRTEWADSDGDGVGDNADAPDRDGDGVADVADRFPDDPAESQDSDEDGVGNNADAFPFDGMETADSDDDGVGDNADEFPNDAMETADSDGDGIGDNADEFPDGDQQLRLFQAVNAYDVTTGDTAVKAEIASVGMAIRTSAMAAAGAQDGGASAMAAWAADTADNPDTRQDESAEGMLIITFDPVTGDNLVSDTMGDADADPVVTPNAKMIAGVDGFMHGFDIARGELRVIAFTNKVQNTPAIPSTPVTVTESARGSRITGLGTAGTGAEALNRTGVTYDHDDNPATTALTGTLTCGSGCSLSSTGTGGSLEVTISGYTFQGAGTIVEVEEALENDYLVFGLWLDEDSTSTPPGADSFGAFADGGEPFDTGNVDALTGEALYTGTAVGAHHKTGEGVSRFDANASLTAKFGDGDAAGTIEGSISSISVDGGPAMSQSIILVSTTVTNSTNTFNGNAVMGAQTSPGSEMHAYNGTWSGGYYGNGTRATDHPNSVAGTFGVQRHDDMDNADAGDDVYESFVGAFGAQLDD